MNKASKTEPDATADGACSTDDASKITTCLSKLTIDPTKITDKSYVCTYAQSNMACYPSCACSDTTLKSSMDTLKTTYASYLTGCDVTCKTSGGVHFQVGTWTILFTALVAMLCLN